MFTTIEMLWRCFVWAAWLPHAATGFVPPLLDIRGRRALAQRTLGKTTTSRKSRHLFLSASTTRIPSEDESLAEASQPSEEKQKQFDWLSEWYPVIPLMDLDPSRPNKLTLLGMDFCAWYHAPSQSWRVFADACPHRLVPLSEGRIETTPTTTRLQCAYHGWEFDVTGACTRIPQLLEDSADDPRVTSPRACATSFPVRTDQGLLWLFPTGGDDGRLQSLLKTPALIPELDDPSYIDGTQFFVRDMPYAWDVLVENLCDPAHVPFAHHSYMRGANRNYASNLPVNLQLLNDVTTAGGFAAEKVPTVGEYRAEFTAPSLLYYRISNSAALAEGRPKRSQRDNNFIGLGQYCIPTAPGQSRLIARFPMKIPVPAVMWLLKRTPRWITHMSQNVVMDSDVVFLCSQDDYLQKQPSKPPNYYMPAQCDVMVRAFRQWLNTKAGGQPQWLSSTSSDNPGTVRSNGEPLGWMRPRHVPARQGRDALLDRFRQHTDVCASCRRAHRTLYRLRDAFRVSGGMALAAAAALRGGAARWRLALALFSVVATWLVPAWVLQPLIARMECVPWPRPQWISSSSSSSSR